MAAVFLSLPQRSDHRLSGAGRSLGVVQGTTVVVRVPDRGWGRRMWRPFPRRGQVPVYVIP